MTTSLPSNDVGLIEPSDIVIARSLDHDFGALGAANLVKRLVQDVFKRRIALVSSFGSGSAVMLHMVAQADPATPVLFLDTGKHFGETRRYRDELAGLLGLTNVRNITPDPVVIEERDPQGVLWSQQPDDCCFIRKVAPLNRALGDFDAWFTGRRSGQSGTRAALPRFEGADGRVKVNGLAGWSQAVVDDYFEEFKLPRHPLEADGFLSIGCMPCTDRVANGEDPRAGRWRGRDKDECGIHLPGQPFTDFGADI